MSNFEILYSLGGMTTGGSRSISNTDFIGESIERILIGPGTPPHDTVRVEKCAFRQCAVRGEFRIANGAELSEVLFDRVRSPDVLIISSQSVLDRVVVKGGSNLRGLWVKPSEFATAQKREEFDKWVALRSNSISWMLDFSELDAEVEVLGLPIEKLRWHRERHVPLQLHRFKNANWKEMKFPLTSFWRLCAKRLEIFGVNEGVFSLPRESDKTYLQTRAEMLQLQQAGFLD